MMKEQRNLRTRAFGSALTALAFLAPAAARAQDTAPPPPPAAAPAPAPAADAPPLPPPPAVAAPAPAPPAQDDKYKKINYGVWLLVGGRLQDVAPGKSDKMSQFRLDSSELDLLFDGQVNKYVAWQANLTAGFNNDRDGSGSVALLDLIAKLELDDAFHVWFGRMLVPSDRANFAGRWFESPWYYPGTYAFPTLGYIGPMQGPNGRNDGVTVWGQFGGGMFKYYAGAFGLQQHPNATTPDLHEFYSGRLNLSLINPEPGFYHNSSYYGEKDLLAIGVSGQYQKNGWNSFGGAAPPGNPTAPGVESDYSEVSADLLFEKNIGGGAVDVEGAFYKYMGDTKTLDTAWLGLVSYMLPDMVGVGKIQPLVRVQSAKAPTGDPTTSIEGQLAYVMDSFHARFALGYQHVDYGGNLTKSNGIYVGVQIKE